MHAQTDNELVTFRELVYWPSLFEIWNGGSVFRVLAALARYHEPPPDPTESPPDAAERIARYRIAPLDEPYVRMLFDELPRVAVWHVNRSPDPLQYVLVHKRDVTFAGFQTNRMAPVWRWPYWYFAFYVFWEPMFCVENVRLHHPDDIWERLLHILEHMFPDEMRDAQQRCWAYLALYERLLGIEHDRAQKYGIYTGRILNCPFEGLPGKLQRRELFDQAIAWLKDKIRIEIAVLKQS
ncbi:MAG: hypothetical protein WC544_01165 [Patescibacteria group bacterium]